MPSWATGVVRQNGTSFVTMVTKMRAGVHENNREAWNRGGGGLMAGL